MPKILLKIIALVLIPALIQQPALSAQWSVVSRPPTVHGSLSTDNLPFGSQAVVEPAVESPRLPVLGNTLSWKIKATEGHAKPQTGTEISRRNVVKVLGAMAGFLIGGISLFALPAELPSTARTREQILADLFNPAKRERSRATLLKAAGESRDVQRELLLFLIREIQRQTTQKYAAALAPGRSSQDHAAWIQFFSDMADEVVRQPGGRRALWQLAAAPLSTEVRRAALEILDKSYQREPALRAGIDETNPNDVMLLARLSARPGFENVVTALAPRAVGDDILLRGALLWNLLLEKRVAEDGDRKAAADRIKGVLAATVNLQFILDLLEQKTNEASSRLIQDALELVPDARKNGHEMLTAWELSHLDTYLPSRALEPYFLLLLEKVEVEDDVTEFVLLRIMINAQRVAEALGEKDRAQKMADARQNRLGKPHAFEAAVELLLEGVTVQNTFAAMQMLSSMDVRPLNDRPDVIESLLYHVKLPAFHDAAANLLKKLNLDRNQLDSIDEADKIAEESQASDRKMREDLFARLKTWKIPEGSDPLDYQTRERMMRDLGLIGPDVEQMPSFARQTRTFDAMAILEEAVTPDSDPALLRVWIRILDTIGEAVSSGEGGRLYRTASLMMTDSEVGAAALRVLSRRNYASELIVPILEAILRKEAASGHANSTGDPVLDRNLDSMSHAQLESAFLKIFSSDALDSAVRYAALRHLDKKNRDGLAWALVQEPGAMLALVKLIGDPRIGSTVEEILDAKNPIKSQADKDQDLAWDYVSDFLRIRRELLLQYHPERLTQPELLQLVESGTDDGRAEAIRQLANLRRKNPNLPKVRFNAVDAGVLSDALFEADRMDAALEVMAGMEPADRVAHAHWITSLVEGRLEAVLRHDTNRQRMINRLIAVALRWEGAAEVVRDLETTLDYRLLQEFKKLRPVAELKQALPEDPTELALEPTQQPAVIAESVTRTASEANPAQHFNESTQRWQLGKLGTLLGLSTGVGVVVLAGWLGSDWPAILRQGLLVASGFVTVLSMAFGVPAVRDLKNLGKLVIAETQQGMPASTRWFFAPEGIRSKTPNELLVRMSDHLGRQLNRGEWISLVRIAFEERHHQDGRGEFLAKTLAAFDALRWRWEHRRDADWSAPALELMDSTTRISAPDDFAHKLLWRAKEVFGILSDLGRLRIERQPAFMEIPDWGIRMPVRLPFHIFLAENKNPPTPGNPAPSPSSQASGAGATTSPEDILAQAQRLKETGRLPEAAQLLRALTRTHPRRAVVGVALEMLGEIYLLQERYNPVREVFFKALSIGLKSSRLYHMMAEASWALGKRQEAVRFLQTEAQLDPNGIQAHLSLALDAWAIGDISVSLGAFQRLLQIQKDPSLTLKKLREIFASLKGLPPYSETARLQVEKAGATDPALTDAFLQEVQAHPADPVARFNLIRLYLQAGKMDKASEAAVDASEQLNDDIYLTKLGEAAAETPPEDSGGFLTPKLLSWVVALGVIAGATVYGGTPDQGHTARWFIQHHPTELLWSLVVLESLLFIRYVIRRRREARLQQFADRIFQDPRVREHLRQAFKTEEAAPENSDPLLALADHFIAYGEIPKEARDLSYSGKWLDKFNTLLESALPVFRAETGFDLLARWRAELGSLPEFPVLVRFLNHYVWIPRRQTFIYPNQAGAARRYAVRQHWFLDVLKERFAVLVVDSPESNPGFPSMSNHALVINSAGFDNLEDFERQFVDVFYQLIDQAVDETVMNQPGAHGEPFAGVVQIDSELDRAIHNTRASDTAAELLAVADFYQSLMFAEDAQAMRDQLGWLMFGHHANEETLAHDFIDRKITRWLGMTTWDWILITLRMRRFDAYLDRWVTDTNIKQRRLEIMADMRRQLRLPVDGRDLPGSGLRIMNDDGSITEDPRVLAVRKQVHDAIADIIRQRPPKPVEPLASSPPRAKLLSWIVSLVVIAGAGLWAQNPGMATPGLSTPDIGAYFVWLFFIAIVIGAVNGDSQGAAAGALGVAALMTAITVFPAWDAGDVGVALTSGIVSLISGYLSYALARQTWAPEGWTLKNYLSRIEWGFHWPWSRPNLGRSPKLMRALANYLVDDGLRFYPDVKSAPWRPHVMNDLRGRTTLYGPYVEEDSRRFYKVLLAIDRESNRQSKPFSTATWMVQRLGILWAFWGGEGRRPRTAQEALFGQLLLNIKGESWRLSPSWEAWKARFAGRPSAGKRALGVNRALLEDETLYNQTVQLYQQLTLQVTRQSPLPPNWISTIEYKMICALALDPATFPNREDSSSRYIGLKSPQLILWPAIEDLALDFADDHDLGSISRSLLFSFTMIVVCVMAVIEATAFSISLNKMAGWLGPVFNSSIPAYIAVAAITALFAAAHPFVRSVWKYNDFRWYRSEWRDFGWRLAIWGLFAVASMVALELPHQILVPLNVPLQVLLDVIMCSFLLADELDVPSDPENEGNMSRRNFIFGGIGATVSAAASYWYFVLREPNRIGAVKKQIRDLFDRDPPEKLEERKPIFAPSAPLRYEARRLLAFGPRPERVRALLASLKNMFGPQEFLRRDEGTQGELIESLARSYEESGAADVAGISVPTPEGMKTLRELIEPMKNQLVPIIAHQPTSLVMALLRIMGPGQRWQNSAGQAVDFTLLMDEAIRQEDAHRRPDLEPLSVPLVEALGRLLYRLPPDQRPARYVALLAKFKDELQEDLLENVGIMQVALNLVEAKSLPVSLEKLRSLWLRSAWIMNAALDPRSALFGQIPPNLLESSAQTLAHAVQFYLSKDQRAEREKLADHRIGHDIADEGHAPDEDFFEIYRAFTLLEKNGNAYQRRYQDLQMMQEPPKTTPRVNPKTKTRTRRELLAMSA